MLRATGRIKRRAGLVACMAVGASAVSAVALAQTSHPASSGTKSVSSDTGARGWQNVLPNGRVVPGNGTPPPGSTSHSAGNGTGTGPLTQAYPAMRHPVKATSHHAHKARSGSSGTKSSTSDTGAPGTQMVLPNGQVVPGNGTPPPGSTSNRAGNGPGTGPVTQGYTAP